MLRGAREVFPLKMHAFNALQILTWISSFCKFICPATPVDWSEWMINHIFLFFDHVIYVIIPQNM